MFATLGLSTHELCAELHDYHDSTIKNVEKSLVCDMLSRWALEFCGRGICENRASTVKVAAFYCVQN